MATYNEVKERYDHLVEHIDDLSDEQQDKFRDMTLYIADYLKDKGELGTMVLFYFYYQHMMVVAAFEAPQSSSRCESDEKP